jgi:hypothetical protein
MADMDIMGGMDREKREKQKRQAGENRPAAFVSWLP